MRLTILALALTTLLPPAIFAEEQYVVRRAVEAGELQPLSEILARFQARHPGKVLDVDLERDRSGRRVYEITLLKPDGQRTKLYVDAVSGSEVDAGSVPDSPRLALPQTLRKLLARHPGNILELELKNLADKRLVYEIQVVQHDGRLRELVIDAHSGALISDSGHRQEVLKRLRPLPELIERLPARYRGVIQEIELEYDQDGRYFYEIEVSLPDGRVYELDIDAISGAVLNGEEVER